jgi:hypothetical protein
VVLGALFFESGIWVHLIFGSLCGLLNAFRFLKWTGRASPLLPIRRLVAPSCAHELDSPRYVGQPDTIEADKRAPQTRTDQAERARGAIRGDEEALTTGSLADDGKC